MILGCWRITLTMVLLCLGVKVGAAGPGSLDESFRADLDLGTSGSVRALARGMGGKLWVGVGDRVYRLTADGEVDSGFQTTNHGGGSVAAIAELSDGRVYVGGAFTVWGGVARPGIVRLLGDGSVDASFAPKSSDPVEVLALAVTTEGKLVIAGNFGRWDGNPVPNVVRLEADGRRDSAFDAALALDFLGTRGTMSQVEALANGGVRVGGVIAGEVNSAGNLIRRYSAAPASVLPWTRWLALQDGRVLEVGSLPPAGDTKNLRLRRLEADGGWDPGFDVRLHCDGNVMDVSVLKDGRILLGGDFRSIEGHAVSRVARLRADGQLDLGFVSLVGQEKELHRLEPSSWTDPAVVHRLLAMDDGSVVVAGRFTNVGEARVAGLTRLLGGEAEGGPKFVGPGLDGGTVVEGGSVVLAFAVQSAAPFGSAWTRDGQVVPGVDRPWLELTSIRRSQAGRYRLTVSNALGVAISPEVALRVEFGPTHPGSVDVGFRSPVAVTGEGLLPMEMSPGQVFVGGGSIYVGGRFATLDGHESPWVAKVLSDGSVDRSFVALRSFAGLESVRSVNPMLVLRDGRVLAQVVTTSDRPPRMGRVATTILGREGSVEVELWPGTNTVGNVAAAVEMSDGAIVLGGLISMGVGAETRSLGRWSKAGIRDASYAPPAELGASPVAMLSLSEGRLLVLWKPNESAGAQRAYLRRYVADGRLDESWGAAAELASTTRFMVADARGGILVGRSAVQEDTAADGPRLMRLTAEGRVDPNYRAALGVDEGVEALLALPDGGAMVSVVGWPTSGRPWAEVVRLRGDGSRDPEFVFPRTTGTYPSVTSLALTSREQLLVVGAPPILPTGRAGFVALNLFDERRLTGASVGDAGFEAVVRTRAGRKYTIEGSSANGAEGWVPLGQVPGVGGPVRFFDGLGRARFYRVRIEE